MLLVIATVHAYYFSFAMSGSGPLDVATTVGMALFGENRGYPMFAALFGYGLTQIYLRRVDEGREWPWVRSLLRRRGLWLVVIGVAHGVLFYSGDVIAVYGLIALLFTALLRFTDRRLLVHAFCWMAFGSLLYALPSAGLFGYAEGAGAGEVTWVTDLVGRIVAMPMSLPLVVAISVFPCLVGVWAARRRLLEEPERNRRLLRYVAAIGIGVGVLGGVPHALVSLMVWEPSPILAVGVSWLHVLTGYAGGFGCAAVIALVASRIGERRGPIVTALAATGQRSMTSYVLQSVAWTVLIPPYAFGVGDLLTVSQGLGLGVAVWLLTVVLADLQRRAGFRQGPLEWLLRRLTYRC